MTPTSSPPLHGTNTHLPVDKPFECEHCNQRFSAQQALTQHIRTHTGEEPWTCDWLGCTKKFKQQSALSTPTLPLHHPARPLTRPTAMHKRSHTGEKPLKCEFCEKVFSESSNLAKHRRTHEAKGEHVCEICHKDFHRLDQLRRHLTKGHRDKSKEAERLLALAEQEGSRRVRGHQTARTSTSISPSLEPQ